MLNTSQRNISRAYAFWIVTLMFGLPLISSYYQVQMLPNSLFVLLIPYIALSAIAGLLFLRAATRSKESADTHSDNHLEGDTGSSRARQSDWPAYVALSSGTVGIAAFALMKYYIAASYPAPSVNADIAGGIYFIGVSVAALAGFPFLLTKIFPALRNALSLRNSYTKIALAAGIAYFFTYLLLVNQIVITGYNTTPNNFVPSPSGAYPWAYIFTAGPSPNAQVESLLYVPDVLIQLNQYFNLTLQPFEVIFAIVLSDLVAASIVMTRYLIRGNSGHSCFVGATVSGVGGVLGFTATCPQCLAPTLISVILGGLASGGLASTSPAASVSVATESFYSTLYGVILPPLVSIVALMIALAWLNQKSKPGARFLDYFRPRDARRIRDATETSLPH